MNKKDKPSFRWGSSNRNAAIGIVFLGIISATGFVGYRLNDLNRVTHNEIASGAIRTTFHCGTRVRTEFFSTDSKFPNSMVVSESPSLSQCLRAILLGEGAAPGSSGRSATVYRDLEADGTWDQKAVFTGEYHGITPFNQELSFQFYIRDTQGEWSLDEPPEGLDDLIGLLGME